MQIKAMGCPVCINLIRIMSTYCQWGRADPSGQSASLGASPCTVGEREIVVVTGYRNKTLWQKFLDGGKNAVTGVFDDLQRGAFQLSVSRWTVENASQDQLLGRAFISAVVPRPIAPFIDPLVSSRNATAAGRGLRDGAVDVVRGTLDTAKMVQDLSPVGTVNAGLRFAGVKLPAGSPDATNVILPILSMQRDAINYVSRSTPTMVADDLGGAYNKASVSVQGFMALDTASQQEKGIYLGVRISTNLAAIAATGGAGAPARAASLERTAETALAVQARVAAESNVARFVYDAKAARYRSAESGQFVSARDLPWPGNAGFSSSAMETVPAGRILDRFGNASGRYLGEPGATASARGMAPGADAMPYAQYRVLTPFQARVGPAAPVPDFGASGGATQYLSGKSVQQLIDAGHLVRVK
jgi:hypothetical protein